MVYGPYPLGRLCVEGTLHVEYCQERKSIAQIRKRLQLITHQGPGIFSLTGSYAGRLSSSLPKTWKIPTVLIGRDIEGS